MVNDFCIQFEEGMHGEVDWRGGGARFWPGDEKNMEDKRTNIYRVRKTAWYTSTEHAIGAGLQVSIGAGFSSGTN